MAQHLIYGDRCRNEVASLIRQRGCERILIITGKRSYETSGAQSFVNDCLSSIQDVDVQRFCDFCNNPNISDLKNGLSLAAEFMPEAIIAVGGGSVIDMGKPIRFFMTHDGEILSGKYSANLMRVPLFAIPTTAGTGAEATHFAVLYDEEGKKHSIAHNDILPDYVVINPSLTHGQSAYITACSGFDALAQAIEAYWNINATSESDEYALKAIELIKETLPEVVDHPTPILRDKMAQGAYWAGRAINITKTTAPHAFSYPFTSVYGIPHGHAVSIVFPAIAEHNLLHGSIPHEKSGFIKSGFGLNEDISSAFRNYIENIGLTVPNKDYDINILLDGISLERLANNPATISKKTAETILANSIATS